MLNKSIAEKMSRGPAEDQLNNYKKTLKVCAHLKSFAQYLFSIFTPRFLFLLTQAFVAFTVVNFFSPVCLFIKVTIIPRQSQSIQVRSAL